MVDCAVGENVDQERLLVQLDPSEVRVISAWLETVGQRMEMPADQLFRLDLCLNEVLANMLQHGGEDIRSQPISLELRVSREGEIGKAELECSDSGIPFDPLQIAPRVRPASLSEAAPGGQGLIMIRGYSDAVSYAYSNGRNQLTITVNWAG